MAASKHTDDYVRGSQEISEQVSTWHLFLGLAKWGSLILGAVVLFLTLWFMPNGSFFSGFFAAGFMLVAGWFFLRSKPDAH